MDQASITKYILDTFDGVYADTSTQDVFYLYDPQGKFPFATLVTGDNDYDHASNLDRPSVFRLNIGVSKETYQALFGAQSSEPEPSEEEDDAVGIVASAYDFTALDQLMPHPMYGRMHWVCVLNPSAETFETVVQPLLDEAYRRDVRKHTRRADRT